MQMNVEGKVLQILGFKINRLRYRLLRGFLNAERRPVKVRMRKERRNIRVRANHFIMFIRIPLSARRAAAYHVEAVARSRMNDGITKARANEPAGSGRTNSLCE